LWSSKSRTLWLLSHHTCGTIMLVCGCAYVIAWLIFHVGVPQIKAAQIK
jgi:hypothetical protein